MTSQADRLSELTWHLIHKPIQLFEVYAEGKTYSVFAYSIRHAVRKVEKAFPNAKIEVV